MSTEQYRVTDDHAIASGGWSGGLGDELLRGQPSTLELIGDWPDLSVFKGCVDSVRRLLLRGRISDGKVGGLYGLESFTGLQKLSMSSAVAAARFSRLPEGTREIDCCWQPELADWLASHSLESAHIRAYSNPSLRSLTVGPNLARLSLLTPAIEHLELPEEAGALQELGLVRTRKLKSLRGSEAGSIRALRIREARQLKHIAAVASLQWLQELQLVDVSPECELSPLPDCKALARLHVAGKGIPLLPWSRLVSKSSMERIAGLWDPTVCPESEIRSAVPSDKRITSFAPEGARGIRPLLIELQG